MGLVVSEVELLLRQHHKNLNELGHPLSATGAKLTVCFQASVGWCLAVSWTSLRFRGVCLSPCSLSTNTGWALVWLENDPRSEGNKSSCKQACLWVCYPVITVSMLALFLASAQQEMQFHIVLAKIWVYFWECLCLCRCRHATCLLSLSLSQGSTALPIRQSKRLVKMKGPRSYFTNVFRWSLKEIKKICLLP